MSYALHNCFWYPLRFTISIIYLKSRLVRSRTSYNHRFCLMHLNVVHFWTHFTLDLNLKRTITHSECIFRFRSSTGTWFSVELDEFKKRIIIVNGKKDLFVRLAIRKAIQRVWLSIANISKTYILNMYCQNKKYMNKKVFEELSFEMFIV